MESQREKRTDICLCVFNFSRRKAEQIYKHLLSKPLLMIYIKQKQHVFHKMHFKFTSLIVEPNYI